MLADNNNDALKITADVPDDTEMPITGYFPEILVYNWHGIRYTDSKVMSDATVPSMVEMTMADGSTMTVWADGTIVVHNKEMTTDWSVVVTPTGIIPNPFRS